MARLVDLLEQMADVLRAGFEDAELPFGVQVEPRMVINPTPPCVDMWPADDPRDEETSGFGPTPAEIAGGKVFRVRVRIDTGDHDASQNFLLAVMDEEDELSIRTLLEDDQTLNSYATQVIVDGGTGYTIIPDLDGVNAYLGVEFQVTVMDVVS